MDLMTTKPVCDILQIDDYQLQIGLLLEWRHKTFDIHNYASGSDKALTSIVSYVFYKLYPCSVIRSDVMKNLK